MTEDKYEISCMYGKGLNNIQEKISPDEAKLIFYNYAQPSTSSGLANISYIVRRGNGLQTIFFKK